MSKKGHRKFSVPGNVILQKSPASHYGFVLVSHWLMLCALVNGTIEVTNHIHYISLSLILRHTAACWRPMLFPSPFLPSWCFPVFFFCSCVIGFPLCLFLYD